MSSTARVKALVAALLALVMLLGLAPTGAEASGRGGPPPGVPIGPPAGKTTQVDFWLTVLHNNDGESSLVNAGAGVLQDFGGVARFKTVVDQLRHEARTGPRAPTPRAKRGAIMVSSGDNFLPGAEFSVSLRQGPPFYDAIAMELIGYDAVAIGNHEFDFGPDVLADFIESFTAPPPFLSANLDFSGEPRYRALIDKGIVVGSAVVEERGERIGVIGATTPLLPFISSPRDVAVDPDVAGAIQGEIDQLEARGVNKIIVSSQLQTVREELALAEQLRGVDIFVAGGGEEVLADERTLLIPGDEQKVFGPYPLLQEAPDGRSVPVVTTPGNYRYVGRLVAGFDRAGNVVAIDDRSGLVRVSAIGPDAVEPDPVMLERVTEPVRRGVAALAENVVATSEVPLDGRRVAVRRQESNQGNLIADALRWQATQLAPVYGVPAPQVALQNGGGIRNDSILPAGPLTELDTFSMVPFPNFVSVVPNVPREQLKELLENAVSRVEFTDGRFAQVSGLRFTYDAAAQPRRLDPEGNTIQDGQRVRQVTLDDGTRIVVDGVVQPGPALSVATIDFLARGGDQYPFAGAPFRSLGVTYQQAVLRYLEGPLGGLVTAERYPTGGEGRTTRLN